MRQTFVHHLCISAEMDIQDVRCIPGYVCYRSDWDISSSLSTSNKIEPCKSDMKTFCIKPGYKDICTDLTTNFTSGNCMNFTVTKSIAAYGTYSRVLLCFDAGGVDLIS